jgi:large subunit ribosomal protein L10
MSKPVKNLVTEYIKDRYKGVESACVVDLTGLDVQATQKIRSAIRDANGRMEVVKNSLARRAFVNTPLEPLGKVLKGPSALVVGESIVDLAKTLAELVRAHEKLKLKEAILEGDADLLTVVMLSKMKSRIEILGDVAALIFGPGRLVAGAIASPQGKIAGCIKTLADRN